MLRADFSVDPWLGARYHGRDYDCLDFLGDVWLDATGEVLGDRLKLFHLPVSERRTKASDLRRFQKLAKPVEPCIALLRRHGHQRPHVGMYLRRRILHLNELGAFFQRPEVARAGFDRLSYYA